MVRTNMALLSEHAGQSTCPNVCWTSIPRRGSPFVMARRSAAAASFLFATILGTHSMHRLHHSALVRPSVLHSFTFDDASALPRVYNFVTLALFTSHSQQNFGNNRFTMNLYDIPSLSMTAL